MSTLQDSGIAGSGNHLFRVAAGGPSPRIQKINNCWSRVSFKTSFKKRAQWKKWKCESSKAWNCELSKARKSELSEVHKSELSGANQNDICILPLYKWFVYFCFKFVTCFCLGCFFSCNPHLSWYANVFICLKANMQPCDVWSTDKDWKISQGWLLIGHWYQLGAKIGAANCTGTLDNGAPSNYAIVYSYQNVMRNLHNWARILEARSWLWQLELVRTRQDQWQQDLDRQQGDWQRCQENSSDEEQMKFKHRIYLSSVLLFWFNVKPFKCCSWSSVLVIRWTAHGGCVEYYVTRWPLHLMTHSFSVSVF